MEKTLLLKFTQHEDLRDMLLKTGEAYLVEVSCIYRNRESLIPKYSCSRTLLSTLFGVMDKTKKVGTSSVRP